MRLLIPTTVAVMLLSLMASAQDSTVKSQTKIKADDAQVMSMTGCLRQDPLTSIYMLDGTVAAAGKNVETNSRVKTDVDRDKTTVKGTTQSKANGGRGRSANRPRPFLDLARIFC